MSQRDNQSQRYLKLKSANSWDFWVALSLGIGVGVIWYYTELKPELVWFIPGASGVVASSILLSTVAWGKYNTMVTKIEQSDYGELIHLVDSDRTKLRAPYEITCNVAYISTGCMALTAIIIWHVSEAWSALLVGINSLFWVWTLLAMVSLRQMASKQDAHMAQLRSWRYKADFKQRERRRRASTNTPDNDQVP